MCILFIYNGAEDITSDYSIILVSNRDEFYDRPTQCMNYWMDNPNIYGGRDLETGCSNGTWLALNKKQEKIGVLLNLPGEKKENARSRGQIIADYVQTESNVLDYIESIKKYSHECNGFIFVSVEFSDILPKIICYNNESNEIINYSNSCIGFGNSHPKKPLKKVISGQNKLQEICSEFNKLEKKKYLIEELINLLKNEERHLPDTQLELRQPTLYKELSSIFVTIPGAKYGTRAHTILLVSKAGSIDLIELSLKSPINIKNPHWERNEFQFEKELHGMK